MSGLVEFLADPTIQTVAVGAALLGITSGALGCFTVLRRQSLLGDTLSHAALPGVCLGFLVTGTRHMGSILAGAFVACVVAALVVVLLTRRSRLKTDAALGIVLSVFFAVGVVLLTFIQGSGGAAQGGLETFLFGQAAAILASDLWVMGGVSAAALTLVAAVWKEFKLVTFDPVFAGTLGLPTLVLETVLTVMIALAVVVGLQMVGVVLMAAMVIAPAVAARQWSRRLESMVVLAALIGMASGISGALISASARGLATGPLIVLCASVLVLVSLLFAPERGLLWEAAKRWRDRRQLRTAQVLTTLYQLATGHRDPRYPTEHGMIDTYYGHGTRRALARLHRRGLVGLVRHMPDEGPHWELTEAGRLEARRVLDRLGSQAG